MRTLDPKERKFCELLIGGMEPPVAYLEAGFSGPSGSFAVNQSKKMLADPDIKAYLDDLHSNPDVDPEENIDPSVLTKPFILKELWRTYKKSILHGQMPAALKALELIGQETSGMWRKDKAKTPGGKSIKEMTLEELRQRVLESADEERIPRA